MKTPKEKEAVILKIIKRVSNKEGYFKIIDIQNGRTKKEYAEFTEDYKAPGVGGWSLFDFSDRILRQVRKLIKKHIVVQSVLKSERGSYILVKK